MLKTAAGSIVVFGLMLALSWPVQASCAAPPALAVQLQAARVVFVGIVVATSDGDRRATVRVESIWKGGSLPTEVQVIGSPVFGPGVATSIDRRFQVGQRYLFVPANNEPPFQDTDCSATQPFTPELAAFAPADARAPDPGSAPWTSQTMWLLIGAGVPALALALFAARAVWRTR